MEHLSSLLGANRRVILLDGPTGTELERRGYPTRLPLWTATAPRDAPTLLYEIHRDYVNAGADIITACTFRTTRYTLAKCGLARDAKTLTVDAVRIAKEAARTSSRRVLVAGSIAPLEDCYRPDLSPDDETLKREHASLVETLIEGGVDILLVESMPIVREARIAAEAAVATGLPVFVSWLVGPNRTLFGGEPLRNALDSVSDLAIDLVSVNCGPADYCTDAMAELATSKIPFGAYANSGTPDATFGFATHPLDVESYAKNAKDWIARHATVIGGCCGTHPGHIARLRQVIDDATGGTTEKKHST